MGILDTLAQQQADRQELSSRRQVDQQQQVGKAQEAAYMQGINDSMREIAARMMPQQPVYADGNQGLAATVRPRGLSIEEQVAAGLISPEQLRENDMFNEGQRPVPVNPQLGGY